MILTAGFMLAEVVGGWISGSLALLADAGHMFSDSFSLGLALFVLAALIARGIRYYGLAWLVLRYGPKVERMWRRHALVTSLVAGLIVLGVALGMQWLAGQVM